MNNTIEEKRRKFRVRQVAVATRGPFILITIIGVILFPYLSQLSYPFISQLFILVLGLSITLYDTSKFCYTFARVSLNRSLDRIVLDDIAKIIFDPEDGIIPTIIASGVGQTLMYALPMESDQRVQIIRSKLEIETDVAKSILQDPGGIKRLFPVSAVNWLQKGDANASEMPKNVASSRKIIRSKLKSSSHDSEFIVHVVDNKVPSTTSVGSASQGSTLTEANEEMSEDKLLCHELSEPSDGACEKECAVQKPSTDAAAASSAILRKTDDTSNGVSELEALKDVKLVVMTILVQLLKKQFNKSFLSKVTSTQVNFVALLSMSALALQLRYSRRSRSILFSALEGSSILGLLSTLVGLSVFSTVKSHLETSEKSTTKIEAATNSTNHTLSRSRQFSSVLKKLFYHPKFRGLIVLITMLSINKLRASRNLQHKLKRMAYKPSRY